MFSANRGFASVKLNRCFSTRPISTYPRSRPHPLPRLLTSPSRKLPYFFRFSTVSQWSQQAAAAPLSYSDAAGEEIQEQVQSHKSSSGVKAGGRRRDGPITLFSDLAQRGLVSQPVIDTIVGGMGLKTMTQVQTLTIEELLKGRDILAQARTGTGKTLAFLIPVLQNIINHDPSLLDPKLGSRSASSTDIRAIIISPTRELAEQIAVEAGKVTRGTGVKVMTAVGGTSKREGLERMRRNGCHILVGTPGRLKDLLSDPYSDVRAPGLKAFVLDEADRLLDQGFAPEIREIQQLLPRRQDVDRQTLLFSATVPREVLQIVRATMKPDFQLVQTVQEGEQATHERVPQRFVNCNGLENQIPALVELCLQELKKQNTDKPFKAIVYFNSTTEVALASAILQQLKPSRDVPPSDYTFPRSTYIVEIHAKLSQDRRTRAADAFRRAQSAIMLSSDVTARGMDFPNVTHVIQIGVPTSMDQYVHRIGRTARGDKNGEGWLLLPRIEYRDFKYRLKPFPLKEDQSLLTASVNMKEEAQLPEHVAGILRAVGERTAAIPAHMKDDAYRALLGTHQQLQDKPALIRSMNDLAQYAWGMAQPPGVTMAVATRLGLRGIPGLRISREKDDAMDVRPGFGRDRSSSGYGEGGSRGRGGYGSRSGQGSFRGPSSREGGGYGSRSGQGSFRGPSSREGGGYGSRSGQGSFRGSSSREGGGYRSSGGFGSSRSPGGYGSSTSDRYESAKKYVRSLDREGPRSFGRSAQRDNGY